MKVLELDFTFRNGIKQASNNNYLLQMDYSTDVLNHVGMVHASASYALAEISSGYHLNQHFLDIADQTIPVLRSAQVRYKRPAYGALFSKAIFIKKSVEEIREIILDKKRVQLNIEVKLYNEQNELVMSADFDWIVSLTQADS